LASGVVFAAVRESAPGTELASRDLCSRVSFL